MSESESAILNLLAVIHSDGGQWTEEFGLIKSCQDAEEVVILIRYLLYEKQSSSMQVANHEENRMFERIQNQAEQQIRELKALARANGFAEVEVIFRKRTGPLSSGLGIRVLAKDEDFDPIYEAIQEENS